MVLNDSPDTDILVLQGWRWHTLNLRHSGACLPHPCATHREFGNQGKKKKKSQDFLGGNFEKVFFAWWSPPSGSLGQEEPLHASKRPLSAMWDFPLWIWLKLKALTLFCCPKGETLPKRLVLYTSKDARGFFFFFFLIALSNFKPDIFIKEYQFKIHFWSCWVNKLGSKERLKWKLHWEKKINKGKKYIKNHAEYLFLRAFAFSLEILYKLLWSSASNLYVPVSRELNVIPPSFPLQEHKACL